MASNTDQDHPEMPRNSSNILSRVVLNTFDATVHVATIFKKRNAHKPIKAARLSHRHLFGQGELIFFKLVTFNSVAILRCLHSKWKFLAALFFFPFLTASEYVQQRFPPNSSNWHLCTDMRILQFGPRLGAPRRVPVVHLTIGFPRRSFL